MKKEMYGAVVFDMDGVIFDSEILVVKCWSEVADKYGIPDIENMCRRCLGVNAERTRALFRERYGRDFPYDTYKKEMSALFHSRYSGGRLPVKPGVRELLAYLRGKRIPVALASSTRREVVTRELADAELIHYFDAVICGDMVERSKPEPDIFLRACEELPVEPEYAYAIEDSYNGIRAAHAGGLRAIMVPDLSAPTEEMERLAEAIFPSLHEVREYLDKQYGGMERIHE